MPLSMAMGTWLAVVVAIMALQFPEAAAKVRHATLLELQRLSEHRPPVFAKPPDPPSTPAINGFCKRIECTTPPCEPVCTEQPCCCWSTFAGDQHPTYPSPDEVKRKQQCLYPPKGFIYAPDPGLSHDDGYLDALELAGLPSYPGRRLCCLRRANSVIPDSQLDMLDAVPTVTTTAAIGVETPAIVWNKGTSMKSVPLPGEINPAFTTRTTTQPSLNAGDEYENAQMEMAAQSHLAAAHDLLSAVAGLNASNAALKEVQDRLQSDPNLLRERQDAARIRNAIHDWAVRRWANLKRLSTGDASAFDNDKGPPAPPPGLT